ncbi:hypothetical protein B6U98_03645 [Thermoplasmatales archaeon ex4572_165]|nr:MAG: hypothetical protein B6U98_03645 [Thermoplasmatales archaeon ex4572_165]
MNQVEEQDTIHPQDNLQPVVGIISLERGIGNKVFLYVDGYLVKFYETPNEPLKSSNSSLQIGLEGSPDKSFFNGDIDDIYLYARSVSEIESMELYSNTGFGSTTQQTILTNRAIERSPFNGFIPKPVIPIVATITSIIFLPLWHLFGTLIIEFLSDYKSEKIIDYKSTKKSFTEKLNQINIPFIPMSTADIFNLFLAVIVFSLAMSWTWSTTLGEMLGLFILNLFIVGFIFTIREMFRLKYSKKHAIKT